MLVVSEPFLVLNPGFREVFGSYMLLLHVFVIATGIQLHREQYKCPCFRPGDMAVVVGLLWGKFVNTALQSRTIASNFIPNGYSKPS